MDCFDKPGFILTTLQVSVLGNLSNQTLESLHFNPLIKIFWFDIKCEVGK